jgi:hypothetical protein
MYFYLVIDIDARMGEKKNAYRLMVGKPDGKEATRKTKT